VAATVAEPVATVRPTVVEVVICSLQGEVLLNWQCPDERGRLALLEFVTQRAKLMNVNLPLGQLDRLEVSDHRQRAICRILEDRALFVRADYTATADPGEPGVHERSVPSVARPTACHTGSARLRCAFC